MAHSVELLLDESSDASIRCEWRALAEAGLPSQLQVKSATNRPHVTLLAADRISPEVDELLAELRSRFPVPCVVGAPLVFGGGRLTLARLIVPSAELLALHQEVFRRSLRYVSGEPFAHCAPGHWTPHATLGRRFTPLQLGEALAVVAGTAGDVAAQVVGLRRWDGDQRVEQVLIS